MTIHKPALGLLLCLTLCLTSAHAEEVGKTLLSVGQVMAQDAQGVDRKLERRSAIFNADTIRTGAESSAQFRFIDGALLAVSENSIVEVVDYRFDEESQTGRSWLNLIEGGLRTMTGTIGDNSAQDYELRTPVGTIGIRGTDFQLRYEEEALFVAVWESDIVVKVMQQGKIIQRVNLGIRERYRFARIDRRGRVDYFDTPPETLNSDVYHQQPKGSNGDSKDKNSKGDNKDKNSKGDGKKDNGKNGGSKKKKKQNQTQSDSKGGKSKKSEQPKVSSSGAGKTSNKVKRSVKDQKNNELLNPPPMEPMEPMDNTNENR